MLSGCKRFWSNKHERNQTSAKKFSGLMCMRKRLNNWGKRCLLNFSDKLWWAHKLCWEIWNWHTVQVPGLWQEWYLYSRWFCCWFTRLSADQCEENVFRGMFTLTWYLLWLGYLFVCDRHAHHIHTYYMYYIVNCSNLQEWKFSLEFKFCYLANAKFAKFKFRFSQTLQR